jgi:hypothetical protein
LAKTNPPTVLPSNLPTFPSSLPPFLLGILLTAGWWFIFIWFNFNQINTLGLLPGSLAALTTGASDASLRQLVTGPSLTFPAAAAWPEWFITLFQTFWGSFGGGSTIDLPGWVYWLLSLLCLFALLPAITSYVLCLASCISPFLFTTPRGYAARGRGGKTTAQARILRLRPDVRPCLYR